MLVCSCHFLFLLLKALDSNNLSHHSYFLFDFLPPAFVLTYFFICLGDVIPGRYDSK